MAAIISIEDLELLEWIEDEMDLKTIEDRQAEEAIPWEETKKTLTE